MKALFAGFILCAIAPAQTSSAIPRLADGHPDMSGVWQRPYVSDMTRSGKDQQGRAQLPFTPAGADMWKSYDVTKFDYTGHCLPQGLTRSMNSPFPIQIVQKPKTFAVLYEAWNVFHVVPTDGRKLPADPDPLWMGTSVGHWEGDTMVVETIGFNEKTNLDTAGHPHSDRMKVTERYTLTDPKQIAYEVVIEDPKVYSESWKNARVFTLRPDWDIMEYSCEENNKDFTEGHIK